MNLYVGTSGYAYKEWKGPFYPDDLPERRMLQCYGTQFRTVEINNTFHQMPRTSVLEAWAAQVPEQFRFVLKAPQRITHLQRLRDVDDALSYLYDVTSVLRQRLGALLFQLPPGMKRDLPLLRDFLGLLPPRRRISLQFHHESWFDEEVYALLRSCNVAMCLVDAEDYPVIPPVATADWGYLRLRRPDYGVRELKKWLKLVREQPWQDVFLFFKHEEQAKGPLMAKRFLELAG
jgi:uncharacterized protein YecE (DUF72 family)